VVIIKVCIHLLITFSRIKEIMDQKKVLHLKQDMKDERDGEREIRTRETEWISRINFTWIGGHAGSLFQRRKDLASEIFKVACWLVPLTPCIPTTCPNQTHCSSTTLDTCKHAMHGVVVGAELALSLTLARQPSLTLGKSLASI
jgi:hypothetical protein